jgi:hypothetical protein
MKIVLTILFFLVLTGLIVFAVIRPTETSEPTQIVFPIGSAVPVAEQTKDQVEIKQAYYAATEATTFAVTRIVVSGDYALASWADENTGGIALFMRSTQGVWSFVLSDGGSVSAEDLEALGVPRENAAELADLLTS